jgi:hypothetical protein
MITAGVAGRQTRPKGPWADGRCRPGCMFLSAQWASSFRIAASFFSGASFSSDR